MDWTERAETKRQLNKLVESIRRADCTIPHERAIAMAWTLRPDLNPPDPTAGPVSRV